MGMILNKFSSKPIHMDNQFMEEIDIKVLKINIFINKIFVKFKLSY